MTKLTLEQVPGTPIGDLAALPIRELCRLIDEAQTHAGKYKQMKDWLHGAIKVKYRDQLTQERTAKGKDTGIIHIDDDGITISEDVPKKVIWDQNLLEQIALQLVNEGEDPKEYIEATLNIPERKYQSWPEKLKKRFEDARTLMPNAPRLTIKEEV